MPHPSLIGFKRLVHHRFAQREVDHNRVAVVCALRIRVEEHCLAFTANTEHLVGQVGVCGVKRVGRAALAVVFLEAAPKVNDLEQVGGLYPALAGHPHQPIVHCHHSPVGRGGLARIDRVRLIFQHEAGQELHA